ncbi:DUF4760 domain-containing protein [Pedobacter frigiditerrae]|uniref:DUF4760 domain-containing protein n=1 Tax=Pedobacter frigiditerrae TaxID=2530452 RepID=UPI00292CE2B4|nr:DUF4760 domain-containing protein [Pedobacter frigiditerrae]
MNFLLEIHNVYFPQEKEATSIFEYISLAIQVLGFIAVIFTLLYASKQIKISKNIHEDTLSWNKKIATEEELSRKTSGEIRDRLLTIFEKYSEIGIVSIPLEIIEKEIAKDKKVKQDIHDYLNRFERIARGINFGIYNEEIIIDSSRYMINKVYVNYENYIQKRRNEVNPRAWCCFEELVNRNKLPRILVSK